MGLFLPLRPLRRPQLGFGPWRFLSGYGLSGIWPVGDAVVDSAQVSFPVAESRSIVIMPKKTMLGSPERQVCGWATGKDRMARPSIRAIAIMAATALAGVALAGVALAVPTGAARRPPTHAGPSGLAFYAPPKPLTSAEPGTLIWATPYDAKVPG